jgi:serine/threonine protein kinase
VRVTDFGLARSVFLDDSTKGSISQTTTQAKAHGDGSVHPLLVDLTRTGTVLGTPRYMPPEQLTGPTIDARADQFSFCVALYEALWGGHPLEGGTSVSMLEQGVKAKLPTDTKGVPAPLVRAVMRGLEQERQKRFPTLSALMHELTPPPQRSPMRFIAMAAVGALLVTGATAAVMSQRPDNIIRTDPGGDAEIKPLYEEIQRKNKIIEELQKIIVQQKVQSADELAIVKRQLDDALADTKKLQDEIIKIKIRSQQVPNAKPIVAEITSGQVSEAIEAVRGSMAFCLAEVESRAASTEGAPKDRHFDAVVKMSTTPSGTAFDVKTTGLAYSPSARLCIEDALKRVAYPKGSDVLDVRVTIAWTGTDLTIAANVVGQHEPTGSNLNGI